MLERRNSIAIAMELRLSCTNPSIYIYIHIDLYLSFHPSYAPEGVYPHPVLTIGSSLSYYRPTPRPYGRHWWHRNTRPYTCHHCPGTCPPYTDTWSRHTWPPVERSPSPHGYQSTWAGRSSPIRYTPPARTDQCILKRTCEHLGHWLIILWVVGNV